MKYIKSAICVLLVAVMLCGCSFHLASSVNDLVSPISPFGDNADVQSAMDMYVSNGYSLKNPSSGEYKTSYNFFDIDGDGVDEAVSFYEPKDNLGEIELAILDKTDSGWKVVENIKGSGKEVYSLDFHDVNSDGNVEIIVCWDVISNSTNHILSIYNVKATDNGFSLKLLGGQKTINNYCFVDTNQNGAEELLLFEITSGNSKSAKAELYSLKSNKYKLLGETKLDSHIDSYSTLALENAEDDVRVYADALGSDGASMLTEVIYWSNTYDTIVSPFYSYNTGRTKDTSRKAMIDSMDIDNDGLIEIPTDENIKLPKQIKAVDWKVYQHTTLIHKAYSLLSENDHYTIIIPSKMLNKISVSYNNDTREMTVINKSTKKTVFTIQPVLKAVYDKNEYGDNSVVMEYSGYYYLAKLGNDKDLTLTLDYIKKNIKCC